MRLMRCEGRTNGDCPEGVCPHYGLHEFRPYCVRPHLRCGTCRPVKTRRMWQVYNEEGKRAGRPYPTRRAAHTDSYRADNWRRLYRQGWRCRPVIVIEEE